MQGTWFVFHRSRHSFQVVHAYSWKETQTKKENAQVKEADSYFSQEQRSNQQVNIPNSASFRLVNSVVQAKIYRKRGQPFALLISKLGGCVVYLCLTPPCRLSWGLELKLDI